MTPDDSSKPIVKPVMSHFFSMDEKDPTKVRRWVGADGPDGLNPYAWLHPRVPWMRSTRRWPRAKARRAGGATRYAGGHEDRRIAQVPLQQPMARRSAASTLRGSRTAARPSAWPCRWLRGPAEWIGTKISFDLQHEDEYAIVLFNHEGWNEPVEFMHHCSTKWAIFLMSLKSPVETGKGNPSPDDVRIGNWH